MHSQVYPEEQLLPVQLDTTQRAPFWHALSEQVADTVTAAEPTVKSCARYVLEPSASFSSDVSSAGVMAPTVVMISSAAAAVVATSVSMSSTVVSKRRRRLVTVRSVMDAMLTSVLVKAYVVVTSSRLAETSFNDAATAVLYAASSAEVKVSVVLPERDVVNDTVTLSSEPALAVELLLSPVVLVEVEVVVVVVLLSPVVVVEVEVVLLSPVVEVVLLSLVVVLLSPVVVLLSPVVEG